MKIGAAQAARFVQKPDPKARVVLVYGPDEGLIRERVLALMHSAVEDLSDPFRVAELTGPQLKTEPVTLADEAAAIALTGGRRVVRVRDAGDEATEAVKILLDTPAAEALVVLSAGDLKATSSLRKLAEASPHAAALPCYLDEGAGVVAVIEETLRQNHLSAGREVMDYLASHLGGDRMVTRSELEKLALYLNTPDRSPERFVEVSLEDALACIGDASAMTMDDLAHATAEGNHRQAQALYDRMLSEGKGPGTLLRVLCRHFTALHLVAGALAQGQSLDRAMALVKPPLFFKVKARFSEQARRWSLPRLGEALDILLKAEIDTRTTGLPEREIVSRALLQLAQAARRR